MKQEVTKDDVLIEVRGSLYRIPYYVLADDQDIRSIYDLYDINPAMKADMLAGDQLRDWIVKEEDGMNKPDEALLIIRGIVALKQEEYSAYRHVSLSTAKKRRLNIDLIVSDDVLQYAYSGLRIGLGDGWPRQLTLESFIDSPTAVDISDPEMLDDSHSLVAGLMGLMTAVKLKQLDEQNLPTTEDRVQESH